MLTKNDLDQIRKIVQKETREIVREEVGNETQAIKEELQADITHAQIRIRSEIDELKNRMKNFEIRVTKMHRELKEEIKMVSHFLDKENIKTSRRVEKVEARLGIPTS
ncbi:MAG TPA: hypothetical protein VJC10_02000 [Patescibacteria group bacterium]|nr:hypothetical protein [Patescibacteria group bacterium]